MEQNLEQRFKMINIIYFALGAGMIMSTIMFFILATSTTPENDAGLADILKIVVAVVAAGGFTAGKFLYKSNAQKAKSEIDEKVRFNIYQTACIIVWALLEGPGLFAGVSYLLTGDSLFLAFFAIIFAGFIISKPSLSKFQQDF